MKVLGIDYGDKKIGLAIYNTDIDFIYPLNTLIRKRNNILRQTINDIIKILNDEKINCIVVGMPLNMNNTVSERVYKTQIFINMLKNKLKAINYYHGLYFIDERLTSFDAECILKDMSIKYNKYDIDMLSASIILKEFREKYKINE